MQQVSKLRWLGRACVAMFFIAALAACSSGRAAPSPTATATAAPTQAPTTVPTAIPATPIPTLPPPTATPVPPKPTATAAPTLKPTIIVELPLATPTVRAQAPQLPVPVPTDAVELQYDADSGDINFASPSDVKALVTFFRQELAGLGWKEDATGAMVSDAIGSLDFIKGDASISLTILNVGGDSQVNITTTGLQLAAVTPGATDQAPKGGSGTEALTAKDEDGLPVPSDYTEYIGDTGAYRHALTAVSPSALKAVLALYRSELATRKWHELPGTVEPTDAKATLMFDSLDQGRLELELTRNAAGGTDVSVVVRLEAAAKAAGILPPAGKARIYLGNMTDGEVTFSIAQKEIKVGVESQSQTTSMKDVPFVDLAPGQVEFTLTLPGQAPIKDKVAVGADQTWALVAGPGGALPLEMY